MSKALYFATFLIGLLIGIFLWYSNPVIKTVYTNTVKFTCAVYNESGEYSMFCNPIDVEKYGDKNITFGFKLPGNISFYNISKLIYCTYDLNNKRFVECHQFNTGVKPLSQ